jgi:single-stranded-DNA-specific exonuclease
MSLFDEILTVRGINVGSRSDFLSPDYSKVSDPFLLPDMEAAVDRIVQARQRQEPIIIYGDYDIDGLTASSLLLGALKSFGFERVDVVIPNRFSDGFGLTMEAIENVAASGVRLLVTVDCGSSSEMEVKRANELGIDVIITDHHNVPPILPPAVAVVNPKQLSLNSNSKNSNFYPKYRETDSFFDLTGVGVAFKLVRALQTRLEGIPDGQEKWLLDLVALGTICDVAALTNENRIFAYWGLKVLAKTRCPGLKALMSVAKVDPAKVNARTLGFSLGPRMNAAGRLETARYSLDMLLANNSTAAYEKAQKLEELNYLRRQEQDNIFKEAIEQVEKYQTDSVLVLSAPNWNHGIVGIVAAKLLEKYKKPVFVLQEIGDVAKGSARSYGGFSASAALSASRDIIAKGGGHDLAAGVTLPVKNIEAFRKRINEFYGSLNLVNQASLLLPTADVTAHFGDVTAELVEQIETLEPFGNGNPQPILKSDDVLVIDRRCMGSASQHIKIILQDSDGTTMPMLAFNAQPEFFVNSGEHLTVWYQPNINEWHGQRTVEGRLLRLEKN